MGFSNANTPNESSGSIEEALKENGMDGLFIGIKNDGSVELKQRKGSPELSDKLKQNFLAIACEECRERGDWKHIMMILKYALTIPAPDFVYRNINQKIEFVAEMLTRKKPPSSPN